MKTIAMLLLLACSFAARADGDAPRPYTGEVTQVSRDGIQLDGSRSIGFVADAAAQRALAAIARGQQVLVVFGSIPRPGGQGRINRLLSIRPCAQADAACVAARVRMDADDAARAKIHAALRAESQRCQAAMRETLAGDPRHVPAFEGESSSPDVLARFKALSGAQQTCADKVVRDHHRAVKAACELHHCGENIGGGCAHITGQSAHDRLFEVAVWKCGHAQ